MTIPVKGEEGVTSEAQKDREAAAVEQSKNRESVSFGRKRGIRQDGGASYATKTGRAQSTKGRTDVTDSPAQGAGHLLSLPRDACPSFCLRGSAKGADPEKPGIAPHRQATTRTCLVLAQDVEPSTARWVGPSRGRLLIAWANPSHLARLVLVVYQKHRHLVRGLVSSKRKIFHGFC